MRDFWEPWEKFVVPWCRCGWLFFTTEAQARSFNSLASIALRRLFGLFAPVRFLPTSSSRPIFAQIVEVLAFEGLAVRYSKLGLCHLILLGAKKGLPGARKIGRPGTEKQEGRRKELTLWNSIVTNSSF